MSVGLHLFVFDFRGGIPPEKTLHRFLEFNSSIFLCRQRLRDMGTGTDAIKPVRQEASLAAECAQAIVRT
jgi:hypothetical protein